MLICNAKVFGEDGSFRKGDIRIRNGLFQALASPGEEGETKEEIIDAGGLYAIPGLVDIHLHGCDGADVSEGTKEALDRIAAYEGRNGITTIVPAAMTLPREELERICRTAGGYRSERGAHFGGLHLEGPFVSNKRKGAQNGSHIQNPDTELFRELQSLAEGRIRMVTLAPELPGAEEFVRRLGDRVTCSIGHTDCTYKEAMDFFELGVHHITHLFNGMPGFHHREPGPVGAAFDDESCAAELICDGVHLHPAAVRAAYRLLGAKRIVLISDSMMAAGMPDGTYMLGGQRVTVSRNRAELEGKEILAGSVTNLMDCLRYTVKEAGIPLEAAVRGATMNPAREAGLDHVCGTIREGRRADLVLLDRNLNLSAVFVGGKQQELLK